MEGSRRQGHQQEGLHTTEWYSLRFLKILIFLASILTLVSPSFNLFSFIHSFFFDDLTLKLLENTDSLGEYRIRELNDEINNLLREKSLWEKRILELGGTTQVHSSIHLFTSSLHHYITKNLSNYC